MDSFPKKPCKYCGGMGHFPYMCNHNPKRLKQSAKGINANKKAGKAWLLTRQAWIRKNPPNRPGGCWECYLKISPLCPRRLTEKKLTLDHVISRSRDPSKKHSLDNLRPACWWCNTEKGSRSIESLEKQYGIKISPE